MERMDRDHLVFFMFGWEARSLMDFPCLLPYALQKPYQIYQVHLGDLQPLEALPHRNKHTKKKKKNMVFHGLPWFSFFSMIFPGSVVSMSTCLDGFRCLRPLIGGDLYSDLCHRSLGWRKWRWQCAGALLEVAPWAF